MGPDGTGPRGTGWAPGEGRAGEWTELRGESATRSSRRTSGPMGRQTSWCQNMGSEARVCEGTGLGKVGSDLGRGEAGAPTEALGGLRGLALGGPPLVRNRILQGWAAGPSCPQRDLNWGIARIRFQEDLGLPRASLGTGVCGRGKGLFGEMAGMGWGTGRQGGAVGTHPWLVLPPLGVCLPAVPPAPTLRRRRREVAVPAVAAAGSQAWAATAARLALRRERRLWGSAPAPRAPAPPAPRAPPR